MQLSGLAENLNYFSDYNTSLIFCNSLLAKITKAWSLNIILIGKNRIQILFQHTATLIYTTTKLVLYTTSIWSPIDRFKFKMTSSNQTWNIYTLIPHALTINFYFYSVYLFICLLVYFYLITLFLSGYYCQLLLSCIKVYFLCMVKWSHPKFQSLLVTNWRGQTQSKSWSHTYCVTIYQRKIRMTLFLNQDAV